MNGKGSKPRAKDTKKYCENFTMIDWSKKEDKKEKEQQIKEPVNSVENF